MTAAASRSSKYLNADNLISQVAQCFDRIPDHRAHTRKDGIPFSSFIKSAFAMMHLKYPTLLDFDKNRADPALCNNLKNLYQVQDGKVPCDTHMRTILDPIDPDELRRPFKKLFSLVQQTKKLRAFEFQFGSLKDCYLLPIDGTGLFYSGSSRCDECCVKNENKSNESYYHNILGGCIVHPDQKTVIPLAPEAIVRQDGNNKNDCEKSAIRRFLSNTKTEHPHINLVILLDGLYADNPTIELIRGYGWHYIIIAKDGNHQTLIENVDKLFDQGQVSHYKKVDNEAGTSHFFRYANGVELNKSKEAECVNVLDYAETGKDGKRRAWSWITDIKLTEQTVETVMKGGRCRWNIENQTFNTLKNQGYNLEHSYGHGKQHLATNLAYLTFLAFLVDQIQEMGSPEFYRALTKKPKPSRTYLWKVIRRIFLTWLIDDWGELFRAIIHGIKPGRIAIDTS